MSTGTCCTCDEAGGVATSDAEVRERISNSVQVRSERGVLPEDHPERVAVRLGLAISALEREDSGAATAILEAYMDNEEERISMVWIFNCCHLSSPSRCHLPGKHLQGRPTARWRAVF